MTVSHDGSWLLPVLFPFTSAVFRTYLCVIWHCGMVQRSRNGLRIGVTAPPIQELRRASIKSAVAVKVLHDSG